jgi:hypothetical protein
MTIRPKKKKQPEPRKKMKLVWDDIPANPIKKTHMHAERLGILLALLKAESLLATKSQTALSHFIAIVKELEAVCGFHFEELTE